MGPDPGRMGRDGGWTGTELVAVGFCWRWLSAAALGRCECAGGKRGLPMLRGCGVCVLALHGFYSQSDKDR
eukprot:3730317-Rhodomonas_salina.1